MGRVKGIIGDEEELKEGKMAVPYLSAADLCVPWKGQAIVTEKKNRKKVFFEAKKSAFSMHVEFTIFPFALFSFFQTKLERFMFFLLPYVNQF